MVRIGKEENLYKFVSLPQILHLVQVHGQNSTKFAMDMKSITMYQLIEGLMLQL